MGLSIRAYARHRGVSHVAVKKAIDSGRITPGADGTIDPDVADAQWTSNTAQPRAPDPQPRAPVPPPPATPSLASPSAAAPTSLLQARTINEVVKAQTNKVRLARLKGELVDRSQALAQVFKLARTERDAWLNWPARLCAPMAASLGVDPHVLHVALDLAVRQQLQDMGEIHPKVD